MKTIYSSAFLCFFLAGFSSWAQLDQATPPDAGGAAAIPWSPAEAAVLEAASNAVQAATIIWLPDQPVEGAVVVPTQDASSNGQNTVRFVYQTSPAAVAATMTAALGAARSGNEP